MKSISATISAIVCVLGVSSFLAGPASAGQTRSDAQSRGDRAYAEACRLQEKRDLAERQQRVNALVPRIKALYAKNRIAFFEPRTRRPVTDVDFHIRGLAEELVRGGYSTGVPARENPNALQERNAGTSNGWGRVSDPRYWQLDPEDVLLNALSGYLQPSGVSILR